MSFYWGFFAFKTEFLPVTNQLGNKNRVIKCRPKNTSPNKVISLQIYPEKTNYLSAVHLLKTLLLRVSISHVSCEPN